MNYKPLVSIIMPNYNSSDTISEAIYSVAIQNIEKELIIIDDNSTDNSIEIINNLKNKFNFIKLIENKHNHGPSYCRNIGLDESKGDYIAFLDSDDFWHENKLENQIKFMKSENLLYSYHDYIEHHSYKKKSILINSPKYADYLTFIWKRGYGLCLTSLIKKEAIGSLRFPNDSKINTEDFYFFLQLLATGITGKRLQSTLATYRVKKESRSSNKIKQAYSVLKTVIAINGFNFQSFYFFCLHAINKIKK